MDECVNEYKDIVNKINNIYNIIKNTNQFSLPLLINSIVEFSRTHYSINELNIIKNMLLNEPIRDNRTEYLDGVITFMGQLKDTKVNLFENAYRFIEVYDYLRCCDNYIKISNCNEKISKNNDEIVSDSCFKSKSQLTLYLQSEILRGVLWDLDYSRLFERLRTTPYVNSCASSISTSTREDLYTLEEIMNIPKENQKTVTKYEYESFKKEMNSFYKEDKSMRDIEKSEYLKNNIENIVKTSLLVEEYLAIFSDKKTAQCFYFKFKKV